MGKISNRVLAVLAIFLLVSIVYFLILSAGNRVFVVETELLFLPKSSSASGNIKQVIGNATEIAKSLGFYSRLLDENSNIKDNATGLSDLGKRNYWNSELKMERVGESSILKILVFDRDQLQAQAISNQITNDIPVVMSHYYNIKTDLEIRVVENPVINSVFKGSLAKEIVWSVLYGIMAGIIAFFVALFLDKYEQKAKENLSKLNFENIFPKEESQGEEVVPQTEVEEKIEKKETVDATKKASAPSNLPIGEINSEVSGIQEANEEKPETKIQPSREATADEIKERLNKLLRGDI